ncbi:hypothetical protein D9M73_177420 [compost metagenome]
MIEVGVGVNDADHFQPQSVEPRQDQLMIATWIDDDGLFRYRIADDRAVALQRADGEGFANEGGLLGHRRGLLDKRGMSDFLTIEYPANGRDV